MKDQRRNQKEINSMKANTMRERFYDTSLRLINKKGFKATTMRDIAGELGCDVANIYNYIDNKQNLLEGFIFEIADEFALQMENISSSTLSPKEKLREVISMHVEVTTKYPHQASLMFNEWRNLKGSSLEKLLLSRKEYLQKVNKIIQDGIEANQFFKVDLNIATQTILSSTRWLYEWYGKQERRVNTIELKKQLCDFILRSIVLP